MKIDERMRNIKKGPKKGVTVNLEDVKIAQGVVMVDQNGTVRKGQDAPKQKTFSKAWTLPQKILNDTSRPNHIEIVDTFEALDTNFVSK